MRKYPCDPKFGHEGNYLEITTGRIAENPALQVCFGGAAAAGAPADETWWQTLWETIRGGSREHMEKKVDACIDLFSLPGRYRNPGGEWTPWRKGRGVEHVDTAYQFALCGSDADPQVWEEFQRYLGVDAWDDMRLLATDDGKVAVDRLRIVQNRVRILDDERPEEGKLRIVLQGGEAGADEIVLGGRIRESKLNRINCLNIEKGAPYCEAQVPGLDRETLSPVITAALLELGHSGSKKYRRENNAYCSEFSFFVIEKGVQLSETCTRLIPDPSREDVNVNDMFRWFKLCGRLVPREKIRTEIQPGDYISVDNRKHSVTFLGWADPGKEYFWEISGNNRCLPERETFYAPRNKANMVCISKRELDSDVREKDFGGAVTGER